MYLNALFTYIPLYTYNVYNVYIIYIYTPI